MLALSLILQAILAVVLLCLALASIQLITLAFIRLVFPARAVRRPLIADMDLPRDAGPAFPCATKARWRSASPPPPRGWTGLPTASKSRCSTTARPRSMRPSPPPSATSRPRASISRSCAAAGVREGYKAGNLAFGLSAMARMHLTSPCSMPTSSRRGDFLRRTVPVMVNDAGRGLRAGALGAQQSGSQLAKARAGLSCSIPISRWSRKRASAPAYPSRSTAPPACGRVWRS